MLAARATPADPTVRPAPAGNVEQIPAVALTLAGLALMVFGVVQ
jgi:hypothetical protein